MDDSPEIKGTTVGTLNEGLEVKIVDPNTLEELPAGVPGEICTRGYNIMMGYLGDPEKTASTFTPDGWLRTGDQGYFDENGYLRLTDRLKDIIIRSGENISPGEVEKVLAVSYTHLDVYKRQVYERVEIQSLASGRKENVFAGRSGRA